MSSVLVFVDSVFNSVSADEGVISLMTTEELDSIEGIVESGIIKVLLSEVKGYFIKNFN